MTNKYLEKIASDLEMAKEYHDEEKHDINKYTEALKKAKNPTLRKAIQFALPEEKQHAAKFEAAVKDIEKKAYLQEKIKPLLRQHSKNEEDIEEPLFQMEHGLYDAYRYDREEANDPDAHLQWLIDEHIGNMREKLDIDRKLEDNYLSTGNKLLQAGGIDHTLSNFREGKNVHSQIRAVKEGTNGWKALPALTGTVGALGGVLAGASAMSMRGHNPKGALLGMIVGGLAGGFGANKLTHVAVDGKIETRNKEIYHNYEHGLSNANSKLRQQYEKHE